MIRITLLAFALVASLHATAADKPVPLIETQPYMDVARWMLEQPDLEMRAAGLATLTESIYTESVIEPAEYMAGVESILDSNPTGAAVYMLAQGCQQLDLLEACSEAGVLEAVERLDGGNPLAATLFHDSESPEFRQALIAAERIDDHYPEMVSAWFEALRARRADEMEQGTELVAATSIAMAIAIPAMQPLTERCRSAVGSDEALDRACQQLSEQMRTSGRTMILKSVGYGMAKSRAEKVGNEALVREYEREGSAHMRLAGCLSDPATEALTTDFDAQRRFLAEMRANSEVLAFQGLLDKYGSSCEE